MTDESSRPSPPSDLPAYVHEPLDRQSPERLDQIAEYAAALADWKRREHEQAATERTAEEGVDEEHLATLEARDVSTDPGDYESVPRTGAYVTIKETKPGYRYYYWQWREGDTWKNEYIAPVDPGSEPGE